jgi:processive 1,2-diacylglycerol beta-glucosyltransferase
MGGSYGLGITYRMIKRLDSSEANFAIDVVTGLNQRLRRHLVARRNNFVHPVRIRGYVSGIAPLMRTASLLISKPGGATCAEAMIMGLPMIIVRSLPGQEGGNAAELVRHGAAMQLEAAGELPAVVGALVRNRGLLTVMGERARKLGRPDAVRHIARGVLDAARQAPRLQVVSALRRGAEMAAAE